MLLQLALDERDKFPLGAQVIEQTSYVDDFLAGADTVEEAAEIQRQLVGILEAGGFSLSKWTSNSAALPISSRECKEFQEIDSISTLEVIWNPGEDVFSIKTASFDPSTNLCTKRSILSDTARLFDPLGWMAPVIISAKIILQDLWIAGDDWDQPLSHSLQERWFNFRSSLSKLESIKIPRWVSDSPYESQDIEIHGFCDASERAYAAAVYLRVTQASGQTDTHLLVAKSKVAPVKALSIPRLELCGAHLLHKLIQNLREGLNLQSARVFAWTDSQVVLAWLAAHSTRWAPFVTNRVSEIQEDLPASRWRYIKTSENPADLPTRGISLDQLIGNVLWWHGPNWLKNPQGSETLPSDEDQVQIQTELRHGAISCSALVSDKADLPLRYSTLSRLLRITALCRRFISNLRFPDHRKVGVLTSAELQEALKTWIKWSQNRYFNNEIDAIKRGKALQTKSRLLPFQPFSDYGILRVGGRLQNSNLQFEERRPILLDKSCSISTLLVRDAHFKTLHGGPALTRSYLHQRFWIIRVQPLIKLIIKSCVTCARHAGFTGQQLMGNLPPERVMPSPHFQLQEWIMLGL